MVEGEGERFGYGVVAGFAEPLICTALDEDVVGILQARAGGEGGERDIHRGRGRGEAVVFKGIAQLTTAGNGRVG